MAQGEVDALHRVFRITVFLAVRLQKLQFSYHLRDLGLPTSTVEDAHADALEWLNTIYRSALSTDVAMTRLSCERLVEGSYFSQDFTNTFGLLQQSQTLTGQSFCVSLKSNLRARHANGRMFWPAAGSAEVDRGNSAVVNLNNIAAAATATRWTGFALIAPRRMVVVGAPAPQGAGVPLGPPRWTDVENISVNPVLTHLRSRKVGIGS